MNSPYVIVRMDLLSRKQFPREELFRLVLQEGKLLLDLSYSLKGRAVYVKKDVETIEVIFKKGLLRRYSKEDLTTLKQEMIEHVNR